MKRSRRVMLTATALMAGALAGGLGAARAEDHGRGDLAIGSAVNQFPTPAGPGFAALSVAARSDRSGDHPRGSVHAQGTTGAPMGDFEVSGPVTCLRVEGNKAAIKYRFTQATGSAAPFKGGGVEVFVEDNEKAIDANADQPPEPAGVFDAAATQCDDPSTANYDTVSSGRYEVRDPDARR